MQAREVFKLAPKGNYVFIKGSPTDPNANFLRAGAQEVVDAAVKKGDIKIVGDEYTDGWKPEVAQKNMEQILTKNANKVDAVVAANDGTAGGVVAALSAKGIRGIPVSGQDADFAALNRVALGTQTVSVWKDSRELGKEAASAAVAPGRRQAGGQRGALGRRREEDLAQLAPAQAGADHQGQPRHGRSRPAGSRRASSARASRPTRRPPPASSATRPARRECHEQELAPVAPGRHRPAPLADVRAAGGAGHRLPHPLGRRVPVAREPLQRGPADGGGGHRRRPSWCWSSWRATSTCRWAR